ncbi:MAG TPA: type II toxin-antitoxin system VapC family toxin [Solirubrobacterales bacterium]|nr:type II toxin-antitoxin system VapC family toxin [Solirubrobacterales bacterium]
MPATLVDSNVLIDIVTADPRWASWSYDALVAALEEGTVLVDQIVFAEISIGYRTAEACQRALAGQGLECVPIPWPAAFLAGRAFTAYRGRGGPKLAPLPDFFIGAHAAVAGLRLLTRDPRPYRSYYPTVELIAPE